MVSTAGMRYPEIHETLRDLEAHISDWYEHPGQVENGAAPILSPQSSACHHGLGLISFHKNGTTGKGK